MTNEQFSSFVEHCKPWRKCRVCGIGTTERICRRCGMDLERRIARKLAGGTAHSIGEICQSGFTPETREAANGLLPKGLSDPNRLATRANHLRRMACETPDTSTLRGYLRQLLIERHLLPGDLLATAGLSSGYFTVLKQQSCFTPKVSTLRRIADALGADPAPLIALAVREREATRERDQDGGIEGGGRSADL